MRTTEPLRPGRRLLVEMQLPNGKPIEAIGRVAWTRLTLEPGATERERREGAGIGIEFLGGAANQFSALDEYIAGNENTDSEPTDDE